MEIVKQSKENECGVCVVNMVVNHFYKHIDKTTILETANLNKTGMSIYDFEILADKFGIKTDSYNCEWEAFKKYKSNNFMVILINNNNLLHFVVVRKCKNFFKVYDPDKGYYELSYSKMEKIYADVVILVERGGHHNDLKIKNDDLIFKFVRVKYLITLFAIQIFTLAFSLICAFFLNLVIKFAIDDESIVNLVVLCTIFVFFYIFNFLGEYLLQVFNNLTVKKIYLNLYNQLIETLSQKNNAFYHKIDLSILFSIDNEIGVISNFVSKEYNVLMSNIFLDVILIFIVGLISPWFLMVVLLNTFFILIITIVNNLYRSNVINDSMKLNNFNNHNLQKMYSYLKEEFHYENYLNILNDNKKTCFEFLNIFKNNTHFFAQTNLLNNIFSMIGEIIVIFSASFLIISQKNIGVETLILVLNLILMFNSTTQGICSFYGKKVLFKKCKEDYYNILKIGNIVHDHEKIVSIKFIKQIQILENNQVRNIKKLKKFSVNDHAFMILFNAITRRDYPNTCRINGINIENIKYDWVFKNVILINPLTKINPNDILKKLSENTSVHSSLIADGIKHLSHNLSRNSSLKIGDCQYLNLLNLIGCNGKIIFLNNCIKYLSNEQEKFFKEKILPKLKIKNFLIFSGL